MDERHEPLISEQTWHLMVWAAVLGVPAVVLIAADMVGVPGLDVPATLMTALTSGLILTAVVREARSATPSNSAPCPDRGWFRAEIEEGINVVLAAVLSAAELATPVASAKQPRHTSASPPSTMESTERAVIA